MKKFISFFVCIILVFSICAFDINALYDENTNLRVVDFTVTQGTYFDVTKDAETRATGLINAYGLSLSKTGTTLNLSGQTYGSTEVVKSGFKDLTVQRRKTSDDAWKDYYEFGNVYIDGFAAVLSTTLVVESGYQYRISCKHYAKKNILSVQTIANTSGIVTVS